MKYRDLRPFELRFKKGTSRRVRRMAGAFIRDAVREPVLSEQIAELLAQRKTPE